MSGLYIPTVPAVTDADSLLLDFETRFVQSIRTPTYTNWPERFAYMPPQNFANLDVRFPLDLTSFGFREFKGKFEFRNSVSKYIDLTINAFHDGAEIDVRMLRNAQSTEILQWQQKERKLMNAWARFMPPEMYDTLFTGDATGAVWTGGSNFFATDHNVNPFFASEYGTFSNLLNDGGAKQATPYYMILEGGPFDDMFPWAILTGEGLGPAMQRAGGSGVAPSAGEPWVLRWGTDHPDFAKNGFKAQVAIYAEKGWGLMFPHSIIRQEAALTYPNLKAMVDAACQFKDLDGYNPADQIRIKAILCEPADVSTMNELLGREVVNVGASSPSNAQSAIDPRLRNVPIVALAH
jgi:hypothetical protein